MLNDKPAFRERDRRRGFSVVELIVVISIIALVLAIAVPGISQMARESAFNDAYQTFNAALTRAKYSAIEDGCLVALRIMPEAWQQRANPGEEENAADIRASQRQVIVLYRWETSTSDPTDITEVLYNEHFIERPETDVFRLPSSVWAAPLAAVTHAAEDSDAESVLLAGKLEEFHDDARQSGDGSDFVSSDDFLLVFDPARGLVGGDPTADPEQWDAYRLRSRDLSDPDDRGWIDIWRHAFSSVTLYERDALEALGVEADADERRTLLESIGKPYYVHPRTAALTEGRQ